MDNIVKENVKIDTDIIKLDQFLKYCGVASTGSEAKELILSGKVCVNGEMETRRGRKLRKGDVVRFENRREYAIV